MILICTKCGKNNVFIVRPEVEKIKETQTMDQMINGFGIMTLAYHTTTWMCKDCGYSVTR